MNKTISLVLLFCMLSPVLVVAQSRDEKAVAEAVETLRNAMISADTAALKNVTANNVSYGHSTGLIEDKKAFIQQFADGSSVFTSISLQDQTIMISGDVAIVRHKLTGDTNNKNIPGKIDLNVLLVWKKQNGQWKLLARQAARVPEKKN